MRILPTQIIELDLHNKPSYICSSLYFIFLSVVSQFLNSPCQDLWDLVIWILKYIKSALGKGLIY